MILVYSRDWESLIQQPYPQLLALGFCCQRTQRNGQHQHFLSFLPSNIGISSNSESTPWHYECLFCFLSVGSCLIFNFSGPQYHLSNGDSKTQFQELFGTLHMKHVHVPNLPSKTSEPGERVISLCCSSGGSGGHPAA